MEEKNTRSFQEYIHLMSEETGVDSEEMTYKLIRGIYVKGPSSLTTCVVHITRVRNTLVLLWSLCTLYVDYDCRHRFL